ncbi:hypothetical protein NLS1_20490 [Nocardioides sp. LS1]|nr:hypothetical protein NLS1_20490 [Nocardioides sp. LS1]
MVGACVSAVMPCSLSRIRGGRLHAWKAPPAVERIDGVSWSCWVRGGVAAGPVGRREAIAGAVAAPIGSINATGDGAGP